MRWVLVALALAGCVTDKQLMRRANAECEWLQDAQRRDRCVAAYFQTLADERAAAQARGAAGLEALSGTLAGAAAISAASQPVYLAPRPQTTTCRWMAGAWQCTTW